MRILLVVVTLLGMANTAAASNPGGVDPQLLTVSWQLLRAAHYGQATKEHAAFLVRDEDGRLQLVPWAWGAESRRASYQGAIPEGTVGIVHTHPNDVPNPSPGDAGVARRLGLPVYVLTRSSVTRTDGTQTEQVALGDWNPSR